jgi:hypothetical protein
MGDFVQQHLVDLVVLEALGEVPRDRDPMRAVVAEAGARRRAVEREGPLGVEVQRDEGIRPDAHPGQVSH